MTRRALLVLALLLILGLTWIGISGGAQQFDESPSVGQKVQTFAQLGYGILGLLTVVTTFWGRNTRRPIRVAWIACVGLAAGLAPVVWGGASWAAGLAAGLAGLLIGAGIVWLLEIGARGPSEQY